MRKSLEEIMRGYKSFRDRYASGDSSFMHKLSVKGQRPPIMIVACCDSRVDPALILQCDPGELFVVRNVANMVPPYEKDAAHHGTSAALEFAIQFLEVEHLILLGHSQCGGIQALRAGSSFPENDFISNWVALIDSYKLENELVSHLCENNDRQEDGCIDKYAQISLQRSYYNCLTFPWIKDKLENGALSIHRWFFDIKEGIILAYDSEKNFFKPIDE